MPNLTNNLTGKLALVTGGSRGIGRAISEKLASMGATVAINYNGNRKAANETIEAVNAAGGRAFSIQASLGQPGGEQLLKEKLLTELAQRNLPAQLDILVNNAGIGMFAGFEQSSVKQFDQLFAVNVRGVFLLTQSLIPLLSEGGSIINLSSGLSKRPESQSSVYSMTKAAIDTFTISLAKEFGPRGITVNAVAPGWTHTEMNDAALQDENLEENIISGTPLGRLGKPSDIANTVSWLATEDAKWVTGQWLEASGGFGL